MRSKGAGTRTLLLGSLLTLALPLSGHAATGATTQPVAAAKGHERPSADSRGRPNARTGGTKLVANAKHGLKGRYYASLGGLQCVTFARGATGIELSGNAANWWSNAEGLYARGNAPESGSILNFRANGRMRMGHVAVVAQVVNTRVIEIDHANWAGPGAVRGGVSRGIQVVDVSANNDWTAVRVALGHSGEFGSIYPTYGFIYPRRDSGEPMLAEAPAPEGVVPAMNPPPLDLRSSAPGARLHYVAWHTDARHHAKTSHAHPLKLSFND